MIAPPAPYKAVFSIKVQFYMIKISPDFWDRAPPVYKAIFPIKEQFYITNLCIENTIKAPSI